MDRIREWLYYTGWASNILGLICAVLFIAALIGIAADAGIGVAIGIVVIIALIWAGLEWDNNRR